MSNDCGGRSLGVKVGLEVVEAFIEAANEYLWQAIRVGVNPLSQDPDRQLTDEQKSVVRQAAVDGAQQFVGDLLKINKREGYG